jgi:hypothetical protein
MENYNIELLNETYLRIVKLVKDYSNLNIFLKETLHDEMLRKSSEIYILYKDDPYNKIVFKKDLYNLKIDNIYSFLFSHKCSYRYKYNDCSIFKYAERCRQYYQHLTTIPNAYLKIGCELVFSDAGKIIKDLGFSTCLEELTLKMDLMGI